MSEIIKTIEREYQSEAKQEAIMALEFGAKIICIEAPTGSGKSIIIASTTEHFNAKGLRVVVLTNFSALVSQLSSHLDNMHINHGIVKAGMHKATDDHCQLIMEQSYHEKARAEMPIECDVLIKDEFHVGIGQKRYEDIVRHLNPKMIIGLSATPENEKGCKLEGVDEVIRTITMSRLIFEGFLCKPKYLIPKFAQEQDLSKVRMSGNDYSTESLLEVMNNPEFNNGVLSTANKLELRTKKTLVFCSNIDHAESIFKVFIDGGFNAAIIHSKIKDKNLMEKQIAKFKGEQVSFPKREACLFGEEPQEIVSKIDMLVSVSSLTTGFDAPCAEYLLNLRPTKVRRLWVQIVGRCLRIHNPLDDVLKSLESRNIIQYK